MKAPVTFVVTLALAAAGLCAPAAAQPPAAGPAAQPPGRGACFMIRNIRSFRSVDNRTVFVRVSGNDIFALELFSPCVGVNWANDVRMRARGGSSICEGRVNWVNLYVRRSGGGQQRCSVSNVRRLSPNEIANLPRGARP